MKWKMTILMLPGFACNFDQLNQTGPFSNVDTFSAVEDHVNWYFANPVLNYRKTILAVSSKQALILT